jgi:ADP-ribose pyrophosphatase YjhB (NUDIX family)
MMGDINIAWRSDEGAFKLRTAALIIEGDRILLCGVDSMVGWFLPGGKIKFGESSSSALARELREELKIDCEIKSAMLVVESIRAELDVIHQEVCFYHNVAWPAGLDREAVHALAADEHTFTWVRLDQLATINFYPPEILPYLAHPDSRLRHVSFDRRK